MLHHLELEFCIVEVHSKPHIIEVSFGPKSVLLFSELERFLRKGAVIDLYDALIFFVLLLDVAADR